MKRLLAVFVLQLAGPAPLPAASLTLSSPLDFQVVQRTSKMEGRVPLAGELSGAEPTSVVIVARTVSGAATNGWRRAAATFSGTKFAATLELPAGGWYRLEVRALEGDQVLGETAVEHVGVGEVFAVAGQSNSANYGAEKQTPKTGRVTSFDGHRWRPANDPQPGASGGGGSFLPPFGDALAERFNVPVGLVPCGIGATSVREWLPKDATFPNPPTLLDRVRQLPGGEWVSQGQAFAMFTARLKSLGPHGFRAVLWHQGESDANQKDPARTLPGTLYRQYLEQVIRASRREIGWDTPWFVAQVTYHGPGDEASPDIREAQQALWADRVANPGPDSDQLKGEYRDADGRGVHFSGPGLREHAARWVDKVAPWLESELTRPILPPAGVAAAASPDAAAPGRPPHPEGRRVLFLGNSITLHGPMPSIGWSGNWGMAASAAARDYVHLLTAAIARADGTGPETTVRNLADFERQHESYDVAAGLRAELAFNADLIIVAIGENVPALSSAEARAAYAAAFTRLLAALKRHGQPAIVVRSCFWPDPAKDDIMKQASASTGATFIDIAPLGRDPANAARSERTIEHAGVAGHPGDKGMQAIADALWEAIQRVQPTRPGKPSRK